MVRIHCYRVLRHVKNGDLDATLEIECCVGDELVNVRDLLEVFLRDLEDHLGCVPSKAGVDRKILDLVANRHVVQQELVQSGEVISPSQDKRELSGGIEQVFRDKAVLGSEFDFNGHDVSHGSRHSSVGCRGCRRRRRRRRRMRRRSVIRDHVVHGSQGTLLSCRRRSFRCLGLHCHESMDLRSLPVHDSGGEDRVMIVVICKGSAE
mmetsp:Transcript_2681/g.5490  ORF Transcript_2681/g.5490 Transcript_2681/m.5490 type:complete len:207 (-) Transcript_2681:111-731(-)